MNKVVVLQAPFILNYYRKFAYLTSLVANRQDEYIDEKEVRRLFDMWLADIFKLEEVSIPEQYEDVFDEMDTDNRPFIQNLEFYINRLNIDPLISEIMTVKDIIILKLEKESVG